MLVGCTYFKSPRLRYRVLQMVQKYLSLFEFVGDRLCSGESWVDVSDEDVDDVSIEVASTGNGVESGIR